MKYLKMKSSVPTENQMRWQEMEYYAFLHFSINTYTDQEWGSGDEDVRLFNPKDLALYTGTRSRQLYLIKLP